MIGIYVPKYKVGDILCCNKNTYVVICVGQYNMLKSAFSLSDIPNNRKEKEKNFVYMLKKMDFESTSNITWSFCDEVDVDPNWKYEENYIKEIVKQRIKQEQEVGGKNETI